MRRTGPLLWIVLFSALAEAASPTGWYPVIVPMGRYREQLHLVPMEHRPGRPLHIVGNTVRWRHHHASKPGWQSPLMHIFLGTNDRQDLRSSR